MAFELAEKQLGVPKILKPEQLVEGKIDERSIILYVSLFFHAFLDAQEKRNLAAKELESKSKLADLQLNLERLLEEKQAVEKRLQDLTEVCFFISQSRPKIFFSSCFVKIPNSRSHIISES
jgi:hypothetical protein